MAQSNGSQYYQTIQQSAAEAGIPASVLASLINAESGFDPYAVSSAGAVGIAQFMPATAAGMGVDPYDPTSSIHGAAKYLANSYAKYGDWSEAIASYNAGQGAVDQYGGVPPYAETQAYVQKVIAGAKGQFAALDISIPSNMQGVNLGSIGTNANNATLASAYNSQVFNGSNTTSKTAGTSGSGDKQSPIVQLETWAQQQATVFFLGTLAIALIGGGIAWLAASNSNVQAAAKTAVKAAAE